MGAVPPAMIYATALSCITIAAATYGAMCANVVNHIGGKQVLAQERSSHEGGRLREEDEGSEGGGGGSQSLVFFICA